MITMVIVVGMVRLVNRCRIAVSMGANHYLLRDVSWRQNAVIYFIKPVLEDGLVVGIGRMRRQGQILGRGGSAVPCVVRI
jgi:hypothetical protein